MVRYDAPLLDKACRIEHLDIEERTAACEQLLSQHLTEDGTEFEAMTAQSDSKVQARHVRHGAEQRLEVRRTVVKAGRGAVDGGRSLVGEPPLVPLS